MCSRQMLEQTNRGPHAELGVLVMAMLDVPSGMSGMLPGAENMMCMLIRMPALPSARLKQLMHL